MAVRHLVVGLIGIGALVGCSDSASVEPTTLLDAADSTTTSAAMAHDTPEKCVSHMPGELLTAAEAIVTFDKQRVCRGYVTVGPTTNVSWSNNDSARHKVTVTNLERTETIYETDVEPDQVVFRTFPIGIYLYKVDALPSFTGTIEVVDPAKGSSTSTTSIQVPASDKG